ncbi:hypothetical protein CGLO_03485 [Colletotrichum gloeosporioides Cg-14]|uniref:Arrestin C-terminal-like domain-containing protein n=1 Tax=Colletotrichum gloeosporioides (strain Cg-14) TaxID=1237896 RepID=T0KWL6_COLGC|nr:hypothetical protein CGLO_03485 [Colletotrichum gloeosporioides Cg-14]
MPPEYDFEWLAFFGAGAYEIHNIEYLETDNALYRDHDVSTKRPDFRTIPIYEDELPPFVIDHGQKVSSTASGDIETHEWPFKLVIPGNTPETFRGCSCCSISYQLSASTIRGKTSTSMPTAYQPIRINRTVQNSAFELMDPMYMEGTWADNVRYCISIAHKAVALGTTIPLEIQLTPLNKKLQIKQIKCELLESHKFAINTARPLQQFDGDRQVAEWFAPVENPEDCAQPVYRVIQNLPLPTDPKKCSPDMDTEGLGTTHTLHVAVDVAQPDDNLLKFRYHATLPIVLFVSPKIPIDAFDNFVWPKSPEAADLVEPDGGLDVPPEYGNHFDDEMLERSDSSNPPSVSSITCS